MKRGFTLVEMLVVIGIIAVLIGASIGGYSAVTKTAERAKCQELVSNAATALTQLYQQEGNWPKRLALNGGSDGQLDAEAAMPLAKGKYFSLTTTGGGRNMKLAGLDKFGIVTPWATAVLKRKGSSAQITDPINSVSTVKDHILHYALDLDGDGVIKGANIGGQSVDIRATAAVWCIGKAGGNKGQPWPYQVGQKKGDVYSWAPGQTRNVQ